MSLCAQSEPFEGSTTYTKYTHGRANCCSKNGFSAFVLRLLARSCWLVIHEIMFCGYEVTTSECIERTNVGEIASHESNMLWKIPSNTCS